MEGVSGEALGFEAELIRMTVLAASAEPVAMQTKTNEHIRQTIRERYIFITFPPHYAYHLQNGYPPILKIPKF